MKAWVLNNRVYFSPMRGAVEMPVDEVGPNINAATQRKRIVSVGISSGRVRVTHESVALSDAVVKARAAKAKGANMNANDVKEAVIALLERVEK